jgi:hypothetical protein
MATLVRNALKALLFLALFLLVVRYLYAPLSFIPSWNQHYVFVVGEFLGFHDIDLFEVVVGFTVSLVLTTGLYIVLARIYCFCRARHKRSSTP